MVALSHAIRSTISVFEKRAPAPPGFNYAKYFGIRSVAAAAVFAAAYLLLLPIFIFKAVKRPTYVFIILSLFCAIRLGAFIVRVVLTASKTAGQNLGLYIASEVLFSVGFFGLLYSAYTLVLDRDILLTKMSTKVEENSPPTIPPSKSLFMRIMHTRRPFRLLLIAGVALGVSGINLSTSSNPDTVKTGAQLAKAGVSIFFALTIVQALFTLIYTKHELAAKAAGTYTYHQSDPSFGTKHGCWILLLISTLLLIREAFSIATIGNKIRQSNEHLWYPLMALPEILAVVLYATPGLVPPRSELPKEATGL